MSESIFDFDLASSGEGSDDPDNFPDGTYKASVYECKVVNYKDVSKGKAIVITYRITEGEHAKKDIQEWLAANAFNDARTRTRLKNRLVGLGVPSSRLNSLTTSDLEDLVGTPCFITKKQNGQYKNVTNVRLDDGSVQSESQSLADQL